MGGARLGFYLGEEFSLVVIFGVAEVVGYEFFAHLIREK